MVVGTVSQGNKKSFGIVRVELPRARRRLAIRAFTPETFWKTPIPAPLSCACRRIR